MDKLEKGSGNVVLSEREAQALLKDDDDLVLAVYEYWLLKRLTGAMGKVMAKKKESSGGGTFYGLCKHWSKWGVELL